MSDEAERQRRLVASLLAARADIEGLPLRESGARALRGLRAYRANADASAARAMASAFPTVQMLIGEEDFAQLAREFWRAAPPLRGDLGEWGDGLADWIASHAQLAAWPYLADCARLDW
ncbi:MAG TPA: putative DNA-binding domain-containing protein, partial [Albitalea sp.]|nr:putative DNA-binding domain-containing protein [Albitalea sp.]